MRFYQLSLRTILELIFVVAVILAFVYWRSVPPADSAGRYQVIFTGSDLLFVDTKMGKVWRAGAAKGEWHEIQTPTVPLSGS